MSGEFVKLKGDKFLYKNEPFKLKGFNYYPRDYGWRIFKGWDEDKTQVEYELKLADDLKCNCIRTFINYQYSTNNINLERPDTTLPVLDPDYPRRIKEFLDLADKHNLKVILSLFDYMYWSLFEPRYHELGLEYLDQLIPLFSDDPRILAWDVINEPDIYFWKYADLASQAGGDRNLSSFLRKMSEKIRELDKNHLITIGIGKGKNVAKIEGIEKFTDFISFHDYDNPNTLASRIFEVKNLGRPTVLEEFGVHTYAKDPQWPSNEKWQAEYYSSVLQTMEDANLSGSLFWELMDHPVVNIPNVLGPVYDGKDHMDYHFGIYRIDYTSKPAVNSVRQFYSQA
jgi:endo-1,4-beta-mannosidase